MSMFISRAFRELTRMESPATMAHTLPATPSCAQLALVRDISLTNRTRTKSRAIDVTYRPPFPLIGLDDYDLRKEWHTVPAGYMGVCILGILLRNVWLGVGSLTLAQLMASKIPNYLSKKIAETSSRCHF